MGPSLHPLRSSGIFHITTRDAGNRATRRSRSARAVPHANFFVESPCQLPSAPEILRHGGDIRSRNRPARRPLPVRETWTAARAAEPSRAPQGASRTPALDHFVSQFLNLLLPFRRRTRLAQRRPVAAEAKMGKQPASLRSSTGPRARRPAMLLAPARLRDLFTTFEPQRDRAGLRERALAIDSLPRMLLRDAPPPAARRLLGDRRWRLFAARVQHPLRESPPVLDEACPSGARRRPRRAEAAPVPWCATSPDGPPALALESRLEDSSGSSRR